MSMYAAKRREVLQSPKPGLTPDGKTFARLVSFYLLLTTVPQFVKRLVVGRLLDSQALSGEVPNPPLVEAIGAGLAALLCLYCAVVIGRNVIRLLSRPPLLLIVMVLLVVSALLAGHADGIPWQSVAVNAFLYTALASLRPSYDDLRVLAHLGALLAGASVLFGAVDARAWRAGSLEDAQSKAIIGTGILAGPYASSNNLGMGLAMAIPFVFLVKDRRLRLVETLVMLLALVLSASRSSIIALALSMAGVGLLRGLRSGRDRKIVYWFGMTAVSAMAVFLPWVTNDPNAFTSRGAIWIASRKLVLADPLGGYGFDAYSRSGPVASLMGSIAPAGHNTLLHYWVVGGIVGIFSMAYLMFRIVGASTWRQESSLSLTGFALVVLVLSWDEMPLRPEQAIGQCWIALPVIAVILARRNATSRRSADARVVEALT